MFHRGNKYFLKGRVILPDSYSYILFVSVIASVVCVENGKVS